MEYGWLSGEYNSELSDIDKKIKPLIEYIVSKKRFIIIITSDHAGHGMEHGTDHPDDYRLPFIYHSDYRPLEPVRNYSVTDLYKIAEQIFTSEK